MEGSWRAPTADEMYIIFDPDLWSYSQITSTGCYQMSEVVILSFNIQKEGGINPPSNSWEII